MVVCPSLSIGRIQICPFCLNNTLTLNKFAILLNTISLAFFTTIVFFRISINNKLLLIVFFLVSKADVLVPPGLLIQSSTIPDAGHGVFANCEIPKHDFFGPYLGKIIEANNAKNYENSHYIWEVNVSP